MSDVRLIEPRAEATPYRVEATVRNQGQGEGEVQVTFRLRDRDSGRTVAEEKKVGLERDETTLAIVEIKAPRARYEPMVEANYPPR